MSDEGTLAPEVAAWIAANPLLASPLEQLTPEVLELARASAPAAPTDDLPEVYDDVVAGVPVRIYRQATAPTGLVVYFHGGGHCIGSVGLMDNVAGTAGGDPFPSRDEFDGLVLTHAAMNAFVTAYSGGRDISRDGYAAPLHAPSLAGLPPALVILGGCDVLRDEGRAYARRLQEGRRRGGGALCCRPAPRLRELRAARRRARLRADRPLAP